MGSRARVLRSVAWVAGAGALPAALMGTAHDSVPWSNFAGTLAGVAAAAALVRAAMLTQDRDAGAWRLLAWGAVAWLVGQVFWDYYAIGAPVQIPAHGGYLLFALISAFGLARVASFGTETRTIVLESIPVVVASGAIIGAALYVPMSESQLPAVDRWIDLSYPVMYAAVPVVMAQVMLSGRLRIYRRPDLILIFLGAVTEAVAFTAWAPLLLRETYEVGTALDLVWTVGMVLITIGALLHPAHGRMLEAARRRRFANVLPGLMLLGLLASLVFGSIYDWASWHLIILELGTLGVGALIAARMVALSREQYRAAQEMKYLALHDALTELPNRTLFIDRLEHAMRAAARGGDWTAVLFMDVDDFKHVNDVFGHTSGDKLLAAVAERLGSTVRPGDTVARFGGDEFTVLCGAISDPEDATRVAYRITRALAEPVLVGERELHVNVSIGIALAHAGAGTAESLVRDADTAMYRAKSQGRGLVEVFDEAVRERLLERLRIEDALRHARNAGELKVAYQPLVRMSDQRILGFEALMRWESATLGPVSPAVFIPIAEQSGQILTLGAWVLERSCTDIAVLRDAHPEADLEVAVNISGRQLLDPGLTEVVRRALDVSGLPAQALALEITESALVDEAQHVRVMLCELRAMGVRVLLDDFGTGFSSLAYLKRFPVDALKIDQTFVAGLLTDPEDRAIVSAIIGIAEALDLDLIAEGVETEPQATELGRLGCEIAQGFHYGRPTLEPAGVLEMGLPVA